MGESTRKKSILALIVVILFSIALTTYHGYHKAYFYEDEVLSYTLANGKAGGFFIISPGKWYDGGDFYAYTYVASGQGFDYVTAFHNQQTDAHPPVYAFLLHTLCSIFPDHFSKWTGLGLNFACYAAIFVLLYLIFLKLFPERPYFAVFLCLLFGVTAGVIALIDFIRMYVLLMIFTCLCLLWHLNNLKRQVSWVSYTLLALLTYLGTMTHYFYLAFAFFAAAFYCIYKLVKKEVKQVLWYVGSMLVAGGLIWLTWSKVIIGFFTLDAAGDAVSQKLTPGVIAVKILTMVRNVNAELFGNKLKYVVLIMVLYALYLLVKDRAKLKNAFRVPVEMGMTLVVTVLFFLTVSAITPYLSTRYISAAFPFILMFAAVSLEQAAKAAFRSPLLGLAVIALFFALPEISLLRGGLVDENRRIIDEQSSAYADAPCFFGTAIPPEENVFELRKFDKIYAYSGRNAADAGSNLNDASQVVVYVPDDFDPDAYVSDIRAVNPRLTSMERLYVAYYSTCYLLSE